MRNYVAKAESMIRAIYNLRQDPQSKFILECIKDAEDEKEQATWYERLVHLALEHSK